MGSLSLFACCLVLVVVPVVFETYVAICVSQGENGSIHSETLSSDLMGCEKKERNWDVLAPFPCSAYFCLFPVEEIDGDEGHSKQQKQRDGGMGKGKNFAFRTSLEPYVRASSCSICLTSGHVTAYPVFPLFNCSHTQKRQLNWWNIPALQCV